MVTQLCNNIDYSQTNNSPILCRVRETELYTPIRAWLEGQGYHVAGDVQHCDVVAHLSDAPEDLVVVELKTRMSLDLIAQAALRQEITDTVYVAVPLRGSSSTLRNGRAIRALLRRLELGLIVVRFLRTGTRVEILVHPKPCTRRNAHRKRLRIIREIDGRYAEFDPGGQPGSTPRLTAWRQRSLRIAELLQQRGIASPRELRDDGAPEQTQRILSLNTYGWFERVERGRYRLAIPGRHALEIYREILPRLR